MSRPLRVLHLIEDLGSGGAERLLYVNLAAIDRTRFDGVVCHLYDRALHWRDPIQALGYQVESLHLASIRDLPKGVVRLRRFLRRERFDVIHTHLYGANLVGRVAGRLAGVPVVCSLHNPDYEPAIHKDNPTLSPTKAAVLRWADQWTSALAAPGFVAVSKYVKQSAVEYLGLAADRITVVYNPVDLDAFRSTPDTLRAAAALRRALDIPTAASVIACVARLDPQKGLRYLIEALPSLVRRFPDVVAVLVGGGAPASRAALEARAASLGVTKHVRFTGPQADVRPYYELADVFVLPSLYEGLGIALVEAMAMQKPCVATNGTAVPEVVEDGVSGVLVPPADAAAIAGATGRLLDDASLRQRMGRAGRVIAERKFDIRHNIRQLEAVYAAAGAGHIV